MSRCTAGDVCLGNQGGRGNDLTASAIDPCRHHEQAQGPGVNAEPVHQHQVKLLTGHSLTTALMSQFVALEALFDAFQLLILSSNGGEAEPVVMLASHIAP